MGGTREPGMFDSSLISQSHPVLWIAAFIYFVAINLIFSS